MSSGSISAMISSLKSNNSLRKKKRAFNKFSNSSNLNYNNVRTLSKTENLLIIKENKKKLEKRTRDQRIIGLLVTLICVFITYYVVIIFQNW